jgi:hypothetical protein
MSDPLDDSGFFWTFPVWVLVPAKGKFGNVPRDPHKDGEAVALFTDKDLASDFLEQVRNPERYKLFPLENPLALLGYLAFLLAKKILYVFVDPTKRRTQVRRVQPFMVALCQCVNDTLAANSDKE